MLTLARTLLRKAPTGMVGAVNFLARVAFSALAIWITSLLTQHLWLASDGSLIGTLVTAVLVGLILTLVNMVIRPIVRFFSLPLYLLTFGLFSLVVNAIILWFASVLSTEFLTGGGLHLTGGFASYFWVALVLSLVQSVISWFAPGMEKRNGQLQRRRDR